MITQTDNNPANSPPVSSQDYYPFGLSFNTYQRENSLNNQFLYNGKENQNELSIGWLDYGARMYMAEIGRFYTVDPLVEKYVWQSPYAYAANSPILFVDVDGKGPGKPHVVAVIMNLDLQHGKMEVLHYNRSNYAFPSPQAIQAAQQRLKKIEDLGSVGSVAGADGAPNKLAIVSQLATFPIEIAKANAVHDLNELVNRQNAAVDELRQVAESTNFAGNTVIDLLTASADGVFGRPLTEETIIDLANYASFAKYDKLSNFENSQIFQGKGDKSSKKYMKELSKLYSRFQNELREHSERIENVNKLDGPPIEMKKAKGSKYVSN